MRQRFVTALVVLLAVGFIGPGVWAFLWPRSFYEDIATFPPFNLHLFHDVGAFQLGVGAALLAALVWTDGLTVALAGGVVGTGVHFVSHAMDTELGGRASDPWALGVLTLLVTAAFVLRLRTTTTDSHPSPTIRR